MIQLTCLIYNEQNDSVRTEETDQKVYEIKNDGKTDREVQSRMGRSDAEGAVALNKIKPHSNHIRYWTNCTQFKFIFSTLLLE